MQAQTGQEPIAAIEAMDQTQRQTGDAVIAGTIISSHSLTHLYVNGFQLIIPKIAQDLALVPFQVGLIGSVMSVSSGATSLLAGFAADMFQHRRGLMLVLALTLLGSGYLLASLIPVYLVLLLTIAVASAGNSLWHPPAVGVLSQRFPRQRGLMISLHRSTGSIGDTIGPTVVGFLLLTLSWQVVLRFGVPVALGLAVLVAALLWNVGGPKGQVVSFRANLETQLSSLRTALRNPAMLTLLVVTALRGMGDRAVTFFLPFYLTQDLGMNTLQAGISLSLLTLPLIVTGPLFGALSDRLGRKPVIVALMLGGSVTPLLIVSAGSGLSLMLVLFIVGTVMYAVTSVMQAAALDIVEGQRLEGTFIGLSWAFNSVFNSVSLALAGILTQAFGFRSAFYYGSVLAFAGLLVSTRLPRLGARYRQATAVARRG